MLVLKPGAVVRSKVNSCHAFATVVFTFTSINTVGLPFPSFGEVESSILYKISVPTLGDQTFIFTVVPFV
ncbi:hypothetical protein D3C86_2102890 [compost metagenome]